MQKKKVLLLTYKQMQKKFEWKGLPVLIIYCIRNAHRTPLCCVTFQ